MVFPDADARIIIARRILTASCRPRRTIRSRACPSSSVNRRTCTGFAIADPSHEQEQIPAHHRKPRSPHLARQTFTDSALGLPTGPFGTIVVDVPGREFTYRFTAEDVVWTAKLVELETSDPQNRLAVVWAMVNNYALFAHKIRKFSTFTEFIRAYSTTLQPVLVNVAAAKAHYGNPGSQYEPVEGAGTYQGTTIPRGQLKRHRDFQKIPWAEIPAASRALAERALKGYAGNPGIGNASKFGSSRIWWKRKHHTRAEPTKEEWKQYTQQVVCDPPCSWIGEIPGLDQMSNAFFLDHRARSLPPNAVRVMPAT
ncbi:hypothetical protein [Pseudofrankia sp. BMG5.37]|uniref:hypothetical protein n=1 Tax=Pseudofrankia sp. BMG5.37 TaxID=3050035 RepID=UPI0028959853|nr:hypothetical protein [Pseudofrankia sp. BMG5.37]MDT3446926.1 hypothetical protein [Pseudofrankia sp. BMG5.37]